MNSASLYVPSQCVAPNVSLRYVYGGELKKVATRRILIDSYEYEMCDNSSKNMWANSKCGLWGAGYINTEEDPRRAERVGRLGEMAFCKISNSAMDISYLHGGDETDTIFRNQKINIKASVKLYGVVMVRCEMGGVEIPLKDDYYVFCVVNRDDRIKKVAEIHMLGYLPREEMVSKPKIPKKSWVNHVCTYHEIYPIKHLLRV